jgi:hypothetical protein
VRSWQSGKGVDAIANVVMADGKVIQCGLNAVHLITGQIADETWEKWTPEQVMNGLSSRRLIPGIAKLNTDGAFPTTWIFRTDDGGMGILQIVGFTENPRGVKLRYKLVLEAGESVQSTGGEPHSITPLTASGFGLVIEQGGRLSLSGPPFGGPRSRTFILQHRLASEMADDLRQILLGRVGMEARPAPDNMQLTVTAPPDVLNRVSTFVTVADWPKRIVPGPDHEYPHADAEQAGRS